MESPVINEKLVESCKALFSELCAQHKHERNQNVTYALVSEDGVSHKCVMAPCYAALGDMFGVKNKPEIICSVVCNRVLNSPESMKYLEWMLSEGPFSHTKPVLVDGCVVISAHKPTNHIVAMLSSIRSLVEYPTQKDIWLKLVEAGVDKMVAHLVSFLSNKANGNLYAIDNLYSSHTPFCADSMDKEVYNRIKSKKFVSTSGLLSDGKGYRGQPGGRIQGVYSDVSSDLVDFCKELVKNAAQKSKVDTKTNPFLPKAKPDRQDNVKVSFDELVRLCKNLEEFWNVA